MNLRKTIALFGCTIPTLLSCNAASIAGTYSFQLGKEEGTHIGVYLNLTDNEYKKDEAEQKILEDGLKDFTISLSYKMPDGEGTASAINDILEIFVDKTGKAVIPGYYKRTGSLTKNGEDILKFGFNFDYMVDKFVDVFNKERAEGTDPISREDFQPILDTLYTETAVRVIQSIAYSTYKENAVNIYIPVSLDDAYYQLYWYGVDVKINLSLDVGVPLIEFDTSIPQHDFGTKPTKEDIDKINETFKEDHKDCELPGFNVYDSYRGFNQVKLTLTKA